MAHRDIPTAAGERRVTPLEGGMRRETPAAAEPVEEIPEIHYENQRKTEIKQG